MSQKHFKTEIFIRMLREVEVSPSQGMKMGKISRQLGVSEQGYYRWRREYGGLKSTQAKRMKELEQQNNRLKKTVADFIFDKLIMRKASAETYKPL
jgi:putative transposase